MMDLNPRCRDSLGRGLSFFFLFNPSEEGRTRASGWEQKPDMHSKEVENMHFLTVRCNVITRNNYEGERWLLPP